MAIASSAGLGTAYDSSRVAPDVESERGTMLLIEHFDSGSGDIGGTIVWRAERGVNDPTVKTEIESLLARVDALDGVTVESPYEPGGERLVGRQGADAGLIAYAEVSLAQETSATEAAETGGRINELIDEAGLRSQSGLAVEVGGAWLAEPEPPDTELIGLAFAMFVLMAALGSVVAMGATVGTAIVGVTIGVAGTVLLSNVTTVPEFSPIIGVMIGLGVGIDYSLFIITRYRENLNKAMSPAESIAAALDSAGRAVVFAGVTVVISLLGLLLTGLAFISGLGLSAALTVALVMAASMTLLPAALSIIGDRITRTRVRGVVVSALTAVALFGVGIGARPLLLGLPLALFVFAAGAYGGKRNPLRRALRRREEKPLRDTRWYRLSRLVQARPWCFAIGGTAMLIALAAPVLDLRLGFADEGNFPEDSTTRKAYDLLAEGFGPGANGPLIVVGETPSPEHLAAFDALSARLGATEGVAFASPAIPSANGQAALIRLQPTTGPQSAETKELVDRLRAEVIPGTPDADAMVTGLTAFGIDFTDYLSQRLLVLFAVVLGASFLLLMAVFRSLVVPLKAVVMNMLSIGAAYGISVMVFQWGWLGGLLGIEPAPIEPFIPIMLFAILFGLSMDYEVFLLSRMKEEFERTGDPVNSVADGLAATARVITAAAAIMVVVFGSFVLEDNRAVKLFGIGLASAIAIDATIVRMLIVPSTMELLGARNWWLPRWLDRVVPSVRVEQRGDTA